MNKKIPKIDLETCIGCGMCSALYEEVYGLDDETQKAFVHQRALSNTLDDAKLQETVDICPTGSISLEESPQ